MYLYLYACICVCMHEFDTKYCLGIHSLMSYDFDISHMIWCACDLNNILSAKIVFFEARTCYAHAWVFSNENVCCIWIHSCVYTHVHMQNYVYISVLTNRCLHDVPSLLRQHMHRARTWRRKLILYSHTSAYWQWLGPCASYTTVTLLLYIATWSLPTWCVSRRFLVKLHVFMFYSQACIDVLHLYMYVCMCACLHAFCKQDSLHLFECTRIACILSCVYLCMCTCACIRPPL